MQTVIDIVTYKLHGFLYALHIEKVIKVINAVAITPLADAPENVSGIINFKGTIVPVYNTRKRLSLPPKDIDLSDVLILVKTANRIVALVADEIIDVQSISKDLIAFCIDATPESINTGVIKLNNQIVLIHDIDKFLNPYDEKRLNHALEVLKT